jgi:hypothetical protein
MQGCSKELLFLGTITRRRLREEKEKQEAGLEPGKLENDPGRCADRSTWCRHDPFWRLSVHSVLYDGNSNALLHDLVADL